MEQGVGTNENGSVEGNGIDRDDSDDGKSDSLKRNSLVVDDFPDFDPDGLEVEDDWRDVFDDEDDTNDPMNPTTLEFSAGDDNDVKISGDDSTTDSINSSTLMPPPPPLKESTSAAATTAVTTNMSTAFSAIPEIEGLVVNRPPLDHSITRRIKTAGTVDRRDSAPPSWHSEAADLPHRQAMVQDM